MTAERMIELLLSSAPDSESVALSRQTREFISACMWRTLNDESVTMTTQERVELDSLLCDLAHAEQDEQEQE